ncbi:MAG TPA: hypothetical protein VMI56_05550 [Reyranella sp.]|nr:hypothetical protein [Reyranella sp.]
MAKSKRSAKPKGKSQKQDYIHQQHLDAASVAIHGKIGNLKEGQFYPEHDKRTESPAYKKVHDHLVKDLDLPCLVCGVKFSTLKDAKENLHGAKQLETHHHVIEWALANAIDPAKFNKAIRPNLANKHADQPMYKSDMTAQQVRDWVDHSPDNLWVLCDIHHRHTFVGIHAVTYPNWCPQDLLSDAFLKAVAAEIAKVAPAKKPAAKKKAAKKKKR